MYACIIRETFVFTVFRRVFHSILKLELCRHACRRRDQIIPTCRYGKNMPTTALGSTETLGWQFAGKMCATKRCGWIAGFYMYVEILLWCHTDSQSIKFTLVSSAQLCALYLIRQNDNISWYHRHNSGIPYTPYSFRVRIRVRISVRVRIRVRD